MKYAFLQLFLFLATCVFAQTATVEGRVLDDKDEPISGIEIRLDPANAVSFTDFQGMYKFEEVEAGEYLLIYGSGELDRITISVKPNETKLVADLVILGNSLSTTDSEDNILSNLDILEASDETSSVSSLLTASRDVFLNKAGFQFGSDVFFNIRGYDSQYSDFMVNGIRLENPETGWQPFSVVGGLNDVLRYRDVETIGANKLDNGFGEVGGARDFQLRPSEYGSGGRLTYSNLNRFYNQRVMATYASGENPSGISYVVSGSKRWAEEGYVEGTYYDAYAGFAAVEAEVSENYSVALTGIASPRRRGTQSIHIQEAYDITGDNYYNADWGWQNGQKRNARLRKNFNPIVQLTNYITVSDNTSLQVTGSYLFGRDLRTRIERQNAANPDPDYFREFEDGTFALEPQIDWVSFYRANLDGTDDTDQFDGLWSNYILEENIRGDSDLQIAAQANTILTDRIQLDYGVNFKHYNGHYYKEVADLLGGDYWRNVDAFSGNLPHFAGEVDERKVVGEVFGYDYDLNKRSYDAYIQSQFSLNQFDFFVAGTIGQTELWREGNVQMTQFESNSLGKGEVRDFLTYGGKAGATYKLDGRNYFSVNGMYYEKPPLLNVAWVAPRTRDGFNDLSEGETVYGGEVNYNHRSPNLKVRTTGYATRFDGQADAILTFFDAGFDEGFGTFFTNGIEKLHVGGEFGFDYKLNPEWAVSGAAAMGKYTIMNRPTVSAYEDVNSSPIFQPTSSYLIDFYEDNTPQTAYNLGLTWRAPKRIILNVDGNYYDDAYASPSALRRTAPVAGQFEQVNGLSEEETLAFLTKQERLPNAYRLNLSLYKEIRFSYDKQIGINASVNNLLDDQDYPSLAFEQLRVDASDVSGSINPNQFPTRYRYSPGRTYFINIAYKFR